MNIQSHAIINVALLSRKEKPHLHRYALIGALLPDLPMFVFWGIETFVLKHSQGQIWESRYFLPQWQNVFDTFNSVPFILIILGLGYWLKSEAIIVCCLSMLLHAAGDFFLHVDDGHRHFFPVLQFTFQSPISYWDANHYGDIVSVAEILVTIGASVYLFPRLQSRITQGALITANLLGLLARVGFAIFG
ncbi:MAG: hypothetical protein O7E52_08690 [Candidatus Poribacteria bacterium]|nr:hypothetical protein [Candidatus Poribacteria bacterium]